MSKEEEAEGQDAQEHPSNMLKKQKFEIYQFHSMERYLMKNMNLE